MFKDGHCSFTHSLLLVCCGVWHRATQYTHYYKEKHYNTDCFFLSFHCGSFPELTIKLKPQISRLVEPTNHLCPQHFLHTLFPRLQTRSCCTAKPKSEREIKLSEVSYSKCVCVYKVGHTLNKSEAAYLKSERYIMLTVAARAFHFLWSSICKTCKRS